MPGVSGSQSLEWSNMTDSSLSETENPPSWSSFTASNQEVNSNVILAQSPADQFRYIQEALRVHALYDYQIGAHVPSGLRSQIVLMILRRTGRQQAWEAFLALALV